jgi:hypothetical protein
MQNSPNDLPHPELVARAAAEASAPRVLEDYNEAISILRDKKFTYREIAEWLTEHFGIPADHNSVWRAHTKCMNEYDAHIEAQEDEELERDEAIAEAQAKGTFNFVSAKPAEIAEVLTGAQAVVVTTKTAKKNQK